jgi:ribonucleoside-diphosphate reductase beta chain
MEKYLLPIYERQEPIEFAEQQLKVFWTADEVNVDKDIQDVLVNFTESEKHAVITILKLFSIYETHAGDEYWGGRYKEIFKGAEFHRMASVFSMMELAVHGPFYNKINQLLHIDTPEFYMSYLDNPVLKGRIEHVSSIIDHKDDLVSLAGFSMVEGVILYSNFGFLKHYQSQGKNKLMNVVRGANFSVRDENIHSIAGAWSFKYKLSQEERSPEYLEYLESTIREAARQMYEHEKQIIAMLFEKGDIKGITAHQLDCFVQSRVNECLKELGYAKEYEVKYNPIAEHFYDGINKFQFNDFFVGVGREYNREWDQSEFKWKGTNE